MMLREEKITFSIEEDTLSFAYDKCSDDGVNIELVLGDRTEKFPFYITLEEAFGLYRFLEGFCGDLEDETTPE